jgi:tetratricopeptide (TPR) repeat protein
MYQLPLPPRWELQVHRGRGMSAPAARRDRRCTRARHQRELGLRWVRLGALANALQVLEPLGMWSEVVDCYRGLGKRAQAMDVARRAVAVRPTPDLLCTLGELEGDPARYQAAWTLSGGRSARAQRLLGQHYMRQRAWPDAAAALERAVAVNAHVAQTWYALGCVHMMLEAWPAALAALGRAVALGTEVRLPGHAVTFPPPFSPPLFLRSPARTCLDRMARPGATSPRCSCVSSARTLSTTG